MAASIGYPSDDDDRWHSEPEVDSSPSSAEPFDWNQWGFDIDTKNIDALLDGDDDGPSSMEINLFRYDRGTKMPEPLRRAASRVLPHRLPGEHPHALKLLDRLLRDVAKEEDESL